LVYFIYFLQKHFLKVCAETAKAEIKDAKRGLWHCTQGFNKDGSIAQNAGYIVFKDQVVVVFYTNDLASTPIELINSLKDTSIECVRGLAPLHQWIGYEAMHRTVPIVAYNIFMNMALIDLTNTDQQIQRHKEKVASP
jgi:hypothetical protein